MLSCLTVARISSVHSASHRQFPCTVVAARSTFLSRQRRCSFSRDSAALAPNGAGITNSFPVNLFFFYCLCVFFLMRPFIYIYIYRGINWAIVLTQVQTYEKKKRLIIGWTLCNCKLKYRYVATWSGCNKNTIDKSIIINFLKKI